MQVNWFTYLGKLFYFDVKKIKLGLKKTGMAISFLNSLIFYKIEIFLNFFISKIFLLNLINITNFKEMTTFFSWETLKSILLRLKYR